MALFEKRHQQMQSIWDGRNIPIILDQQAVEIHSFSGRYEDKEHNTVFWRSKTDGLSRHLE
jgi:hypothetical protein